MTINDAKTIVDGFYVPGESRWMRKNLDGIAYLTRAYSAFHALALNAEKRMRLLGAILRLEKTYGVKYDQLKEGK